MRAHGRAALLALAVTLATVSNSSSGSGSSSSGSGSSSSVTLFRGVAPAQRGAFEAFTCLGSDGQTIGAARVNDDFCDCTDGRDEPGTSACSGLTRQGFWCEQRGYAGASVPASRVNDGICDCCDVKRHSLHRHSLDRL